ncbi:GH3 family domain-containing protein [Streptomyces cinnamoneus]|uniref:GH3 family domain-containing protein n=1 Tax=Streptomyces cinnamoneus TaxID=53446 RepID=UPI0037B08480
MTASPDTGATAFRQELIEARNSLTATLDDAAAWQDRIRTRLLTENADTAFGRHHGFGRLRTIDDYRTAVPLRTYADYEPWINRAAEGEPSVLTPQTPRLFFTTAGSTGARKRIPVTENFLKTVYLPFFRAAMGVPATCFPDDFGPGAVTLNLRHDRLARPATTASGRPSLGPSQADLRGGFGVTMTEPGALAPWADLPVPVDDRRYLDKLYVRVRTAVAHGVRSVVGHNPSMIAILPELLAQWWPAILRDLADGTYLGMSGGRPDKDRARELERQAERAGAPTPAVIWPRIRLLYCWTSGMASLYLPRVKELYGSGVTVLPTPPSASEGPVGVPVDRHPTAGPLAVSTALYEFVDAAEDVRPDSPTLLFGELEAGRDYHVVFSHVGGLHRYVLGDLAHVVDHVRGVPRVEYAGRSTLSDVAGERLREFHLFRALKATAWSTGLDVVNATFRTEEEANGPRYAVAVALRPAPRPEEVLAFGDRLDREIARQAPRYAAARARGDLAALRVQCVPPSAFTAHWHRRVAAGMRPPEVKDQVFLPDPAAWQELCEHGGRADAL